MDDYKAILERMKQQRADLDQAIAAMERLVGTGNGTLPTGGATGGPVVVASDAFFGMSLIEAAKKYLRTAGRPARPTDEILAALKNGGLRDATKESLYAVLVRAAKGREIRKVGKGVWGLGEWYSDQGRLTKTVSKRRTRDNEEKAEGTPEAGQTGEEAAT